jgi:hypothetical protein
LPSGSGVAGNRAKSIGKIFRVETDLNHARLVDAGYTGIFEVLVVDLR